MISYIVKRLLGMIVVMFLVVTIVFIIVRVTPAIPQPSCWGRMRQRKILPICAPNWGWINR